MKTKKIFSTIIIISGLLISTIAQTQEIHSTIPATGTTVSGSNGTVSYSIEQLVYTTNSGTTGSVAQGVQQPYEIQIVSGIEEAKSVSLTCSAYPNPVTDLLIIKLGSYYLVSMVLQDFIQTEGGVFATAPVKYDLFFNRHGDSLS